MTGRAYRMRQTFSSRFLPPSREGRELVWCSAGRLRKRMADRSHSKIAKRTEAAKRGCNCLSILTCFECRSSRVDDGLSTYFLLLLDAFSSIRCDDKLNSRRGAQKKTAAGCFQPPF